MESVTLQYQKHDFLKDLGIEKENLGCYYSNKWTASGDWTFSHNPNTGKAIAKVRFGSSEDYEAAVQDMMDAKKLWFNLPVPKRGEIVREIGNAFRDKKKPLGRLISLEMGKIVSEGEGEVQEVIDICDMACGLSRTINGQIIPSERPEHMMMEVWNPLGLVGVITAFNFPCAVFGWNFALAAICGDLCMWKGSETTPLVTIATARIVNEVLQRHSLPSGICTVVNGSGRVIGEAMLHDKRMDLISFTGSTGVGRRVNEVVSKRFGKTILELGGNNAAIIMDDANLELVLKGCTFSAVGTCGQRCTTLRRLIVHSSVYDKLVQGMIAAYKSVPIGDSLIEKTLCGPLHSKVGVKIFEEGLKKIVEQGGKILVGGKVLPGEGNFVEPTLVEISQNAPVVREELFVPIMYVIQFDSLEEAIEINNSVPQGLSSSLFTQNLSNAFQWVSPNGSDCGIVNVNIGPSGAEIGGAFGGEKETGGGRESGSDSWKQYMRRSTCTINYGDKLPLAQGIKFDISAKL